VSKEFAKKFEAEHSKVKVKKTRKPEKPKE